MYVHEILFDQLRRAEDERLRRELEYRQRARERAAAAPVRASRGLSRWFRRPARRRVTLRSLSNP